MTDIDISPEAVERLACILEGRGGFVKDSTITVTLRALSAALTQSRAETAAALELVSNRPRKGALVGLVNYLMAQNKTAEARGMRKAAALARQALVDGAYIKRGSHQETPSSVMFLAETLVSNAILAAIPQGEIK